MKTRVIHVNQMHLHPDAVYCGRAVPRRGLKASRLGNPFKDGMSGRDACAILLAKGIYVPQDAIQDVLDVEVAVDIYRLWIIQQPNLVARAKRELTGRALACWCKPDHACHCDVLVEICEQETT